ncbi:MAG: IS110 family transposase [Clostridiales bacterium]|jgi:transposase|nr:IS110 family transposase [Clostridiales bacterium]
MNAVGIDISKNSSMVAVLRPLGEIVQKPRPVSHTAAALGELADSLLRLDGDVRVVIEATGKYYEPVAQALYDAGLAVCVVNPLLIHNYCNNSLRKVKTDKADALKIAKYALDNWVELRPYTTVDTIRQKLKVFSRQFNLYTKTKTALKNNLIAFLDQTFPGLNALFDSPVRADGHQKWVDFAAVFWHSECVGRVSEVAFVERYRKWCKRHGYCFSNDKAAEIYAASRGLTVTIPKNANTKLLITQAAAQLTAVSKTVETFRAEMIRLAASLPEFPAVMKLYGVGKTLGPQLMAEIGDVTRFEHRKSLVGFAGIDSPPDESGSHKAQSRETTKRGSAPLRKTLFQVMDCYVKHSPQNEPVYQFISKKRAEGKPYYVYMTAGANKFLRIYYARVMEYLRDLDNAKS